ncbi:MAG: STAS domain-containing protein [Thermoleophilaceae bacterium]
MGDLTIDLLQDRGMVWIGARGEIDLFTAPELKESLARAVADSGRDVVLDLCEVAFIDSTGLSLLLNAQRRLIRQHRRFLIVCPDGQVLHTLRLTGVAQGFPIYPSGRALRSELAGSGSFAA